jgi:hypothetical protein
MVHWWTCLDLGWVLGGGGKRDMFDFLICFSCLLLSLLIPPYILHMHFRIV